MLNILAISGSTRKKSSNYHLIQAIATAHATIATVELLEGLDELPHFNPDLDVEPLPPAVVAWRKDVADADGLSGCRVRSPSMYSKPLSARNESGPSGGSSWWGGSRPRAMARATSGSKRDRTF